MDSTFRVGSASDNAHKMIYVADLPKTTGYLDLSDYFEKHVGPCQICIKRPLFKHYYYAFVMFDSIENAKKAVQDHRYPRIKGHMSRVLSYNMHAVRGEPGGRDIQSTSIFVKGFEKANWHHEDLYAKFCTFGKILSCKVSISPDHQFLGFGYVQFSKMEEAQKAIQEMDKYDLSSDGPDAGTGILSVLEYQGKKSQGVRRSFNNVYVKNFPKDPSFTDEHLGELFKEFGDIQSAAIMRDGTGESKGFGFVCFTNSSSAEKATQYVLRKEHSEAADENDQQQFLDDKTKSVQGVRLSDLYVREAKKKPQRVAELQMNSFKYKKSIMFFSLFVKNFPPGTTVEELKIYFSTACQGEVSRVNMVKGTQQAFVNFEKQDQCRMAKDFARNVLFKSQYALYVEYCYPKEMRSIRNEEFYDRKAQERKKNQQNQAQIASLNGSQNLVDLLTLLLKSSFQLNNGGAANQQRRSHSLNSVHPSQNNRQGMQMNQLAGGQNQNFQMQQQPRYQNNRSNFQGPNPHHHRHNNHAQHNHHQQMMHQHRNNSVNPQQMGAPPPQPPYQQSHTMMQVPVNAQQQMLNQSMSQMSSMGSNVSSVTQQPQFVDAEYARAYYTEIRDMFASHEYKSAPDRKTKKDIVGNAIYKHVEKLVGEQKAPKITGMLIDLPEVELNYSIVKWAEFEQKALSALQMITMNEQAQRQAAPPLVVQGQAPDGADQLQQQQAKPQI